MTKQLLYYERAVPVSAQRHQNWSLAARTDYAFAAHSNWVPLAATEFGAAAADYAIVFVGEEKSVQPAVMLGLKPDENLYLDKHGKWDARYVPAFVRRYPFVFAKSKDGSKLTLCVDEQYSGWNQDGRGNALFDAAGNGTEFLDKMLGFLTAYQREFDATLAFCRKLEELDLLAPMAARFKLPSGAPARLTGFKAIDRDKLTALPTDRLAELVKSGELELMYVHLQSMRNISEMLKHVAGQADAGESERSDSDLSPEKPLH